MSSRLPEKMVFIDVEASGLHETSYPIEIAWCGLDLQPVSMLVKPLPSWGSVDWSVESEKVHRIPREKLLAEGKDASECARAMSAALAGKRVFSDAPEFDARWLNRLFSETGVRAGFALEDLTIAWAECAGLSLPPLRDLEDILQVIEDTGQVYRHTHRAGDDCLRMAAGCRGLSDREWLAELAQSSAR